MKDDERDRRAEGADVSQESAAVADKVKAGHERDAVVRLEWRDWIALSIASLETILLPAVAIIVVLVVLAIAFRHF